MKLITPFLVCAAAMLPLSSCKQWFIGDHLRDASTIYTGVDIYHPVDGKIHYMPKADRYGLRYAYVLAPEVTYRQQSRCLDIPLSAHDWTWHRKAAQEVGGIRPTGRVLIARISSSGFVCTEPFLPKGLLMAEAPTSEAKKDSAPHILCDWMPDEPDLDSLGELGKREEPPGLARRALIGTCDYVVDPLLHLITIPAEAAGLVALVPFIPVIAVVESQQNQQRHEREASPEP